MKPFEHLADDPFFKWSEDSEWNACIGPQGNEENYIDGYLEAATLLVNTVIEKELHISRDTLVLPVLYNARHALELTLKFVVTRLHAIGLAIDANEHSHDISKYLIQLQKLQFGDWEIRELLAKLVPYVSSLSAIDKDGQQLRYARDTSGGASLSDRPLANLWIIRSSLGDLAEVLGKLKHRVIVFCEERRTGTWTEICSRTDLEFIAKEMSPYPMLGSIEYLDARERVKQRFGFGNRPFDYAYEKIKSSREFGPYLGQTFQLISLSDEHAKFFAREWLKVHPPRSEGAPRSGIVRSSELKQFIMDTPNSRDVAREIMDVLNVDELIDVDTIYYLGRDREYPESYESLFETTKREYEAVSDSIERVQHVLIKTNFLKCFTFGVRRLGRTKLADELLEMRPESPRV